MSNVIKSSLVRIVDTPVYLSKEQDESKELQIDLSKKIAEAEAAASEIIERAKLEAESIIAKAQMDAKKILEDAHINAGNTYETAKKDGYSEGYEKGYSEGKKISDELIKEANEIKKSYLKEREVVLSNIEKDVINMVIHLCEKIINKKLIEDEEAIISLIVKGINSLNVKENIIIKVSKEDYNIVEMSKQRILAMANLIEDIQVCVDSTLTKGGCIIEASQGNVDASIDVQIEEMKKLLTTILNSE